MINKIIDKCVTIVKTDTDEGGLYGYFNHDNYTWVFGFSKKPDRYKNPCLTIAVTPAGYNDQAGIGRLLVKFTVTIDAIGNAKDKPDTEKFINIHERIYEKFNNETSKFDIDGVKVMVFRRRDEVGSPLCDPQVPKEYYLTATYLCIYGRV